MKKLFVSMAIMMAAFVQAKDYVVKIKGVKPIKTGNTEVTVKTDGDIDTLTVTPAEGIREITISLRDINGNVHQAYYVPATFNDNICIITPTLPDGYMLEVKDDRGTVYTDFDD